MASIHRIGMGMVNGYLLRGEEDGRILVDTGNGGDRPRLFRKLAACGVGPGTLDLVLLTHNHPDHTGVAAYFQARGVPVAMHPGDVPRSGSFTGRGPGHLLGAFSRGAVARQPELRPDVLLEDGLRLEEYGVDAEVIALPGHTAGSVGILMGEGSLLCGDMYMNFAGVPHTAWIAEDFAALERSHARLRERGVEMVYPGHGKPFLWSKAKG